MPPTPAGCTRLWQWLLALACGLWLAACAQPPTDQPGTLTMVTRHGYTTYYESSEGPDGFEYRLALRFATSQGKQLEVMEVDSVADLFAALDSGEADFAAAGLNLTELRRARYTASIPYLKARQLVLYRLDGPRARNLGELQGKNILVSGNSTHAETLARLQSRYPGLQWREDPEVDSPDLLELLSDGEIDAIVLDSTEYDAAKAMFHNVGVAFALTDAQPMSWYLPRTGSEQLAQAVNDYLAGALADGTIAELRDHLYGHDTHTSRNVSSAFFHSMQNSLPRYEAMIRHVAAEEGMDWRLLAAISYQESHWNPRATSFTGVRGMMMLTTDTAREMGVEDRLDPEQSLRGGIRYYRSIRDRIPADIREPDRTWLALAAYNVGLGHLEDARVLTERQGGDPDKWVDVMQRLPLLAREEYHSTVKHGAARGGEPVVFVQRIRHFFDILAYNELIAQRQKPTQDIAELVPEALRSPLRLAAL